MKLVDAATVTPPPVSATSKKLVPRPGVTAAESTFEPRMAPTGAPGLSGPLSEPAPEEPAV